MIAFARPFSLRAHESQFQLNVALWDQLTQVDFFNPSAQDKEAASATPRLVF
jgi:hypothetical protein